MGMSPLGFRCTWPTWTSTPSLRLVKIGDQRNTKWSMNCFSYKMGPPPSDVCWFINTMKAVISTIKHWIQLVICVNYLGGYVLRFPLTWFPVALHPKFFFGTGHWLNRLELWRCLGWTWGSVQSWSKLVGLSHSLGLKKKQLIVPLVPFRLLLNTPLESLV